MLEVEDERDIFETIAGKDARRSPHRKGHRCHSQNNERTGVNHMTEGKLPGIKIGRCWRCTSESPDHFLATGVVLNEPESL
jgi:hypothetical protein